MQIYIETCAPLAHIQLGFAISGVYIAVIKHIIASMQLLIEDLSNIYHLYQHGVMVCEGWLKGSYLYWPMELRAGSCTKISLHGQNITLNHIHLTRSFSLPRKRLAQIDWCIVWPNPALFMQLNCASLRSLQCSIICEHNAGVGKQAETQCQIREGSFYCRANAHSTHPHPSLPISFVRHKTPFHM